MGYSKLPRTFYEREDVVEIAQELLGKILCTQINGIFTSGMIIETEAYNGQSDKACHAFNHGKTERNKIMYGEGGFAYIYLCYGIHHLFNVVTNISGSADAVLIRAIEPLDGINHILTRRNKTKIERTVGGGPGIASKALGISTLNYGEDLLGDVIWVENRGINISSKQILASPRVGVDYAGEDAKLLWRFRIKDNLFTSSAK